MALVKTNTAGPPRPTSTRGQGVIEAIVALPVFLVITCLTFQIFFLAVARVQLQYAVFYAARAGIVHGGDLKIMKDAAHSILAVSPSLSSFRPGSLKIDIDKPTTSINPHSNSEEAPSLNKPLTVHLTWDYPLTIPIASRLLGKPGDIGINTPISSVPLHASWTMIMQDNPQEEESLHENQ
jgi:hypothetical protein